MIRSKCGATQTKRSPMAESSIWWLLAGAAVAVELMTGTFYLLMLAVGFCAAALAAHLGFSVVVQLVTASAVGGGAVTAWYLLRGKKMQGAPAQSNQDVNMDIGQTVHVHSWHADGTANIKYRGAAWTVVLLDGSSGGAGTYRIAQVIGSRLMLEKI
jgi:membrane protein implicated in regulation of membrane protease activity